MGTSLWIEQRDSQQFSTSHSSTSLPRTQRQLHHLLERYQTLFNVFTSTIAILKQLHKGRGSCQMLTSPAAHLWTLCQSFLGRPGPVPVGLRSCAQNAERPILGLTVVYHAINARVYYPNHKVITISINQGFTTVSFLDLQWPLELCDRWVAVPLSECPFSFQISTASTKHIAQFDAQKFARQW